MMGIGIGIERKYKSRSSHSQSDDLALVKAAAWAWYQHSSGSETSSVGEVHFTGKSERRPSTNRPTRYKLEAMDQKRKLSHTHNRNNSLMDSYEIQSISKRLDDHVVELSSGIKLYDELFGIPADSDDGDAFTKGSNNNSTSYRNNSKKERKLKRFGVAMPRRYSVTCGRSQDVDNTAFRRIAKPAPVPERRPESKQRQMRLTVK